MAWFGDNRVINVILYGFLVANWLKDALLVLATKDPLICTSAPVSSCTSYFFLNTSGTATSTIASLFSVSPSQIYYPSYTRNAYLVSGACHCDESPTLTGFFVANTDYTVGQSDSTFDGISNNYFGGYAYDDPSMQSIYAGLSLHLSLFCGCPPTGWAALVSYIIQPHDTLDAIVTNFGSNQDLIVSTNKIQDPNVIVAGDLIYIPVKTNPSIVANNPGSPGIHQPKTKANSAPVGLIVGIIAGVLVFFVLALIAMCLWRRRRSKKKEYDSVIGFSGGYQGGSHDADQSTSSSRKFSISMLRNCLSFGRGQSGVSQKAARSTFPTKGTIDVNVFDQEKPVIFNYEEIISATDRFNDAKKVGQGAFGVVYRGILRKQEVAIKQMKATKSKEFLAELKVLCKVHHTNLVELIGYSAGDESLFLVYEYAENGSLSDRLHHPSSRGFTPLSWTARVQIALDSARGLEYIHDHTKTHYVHRDVKTSNILLDGDFRAKIADFGLAKLVEQSSDLEAATTKVVGTFGYLAPEYVRDGHATSKSDVYAFGVVLFELITGNEALSKTRSVVDTTKNDRRSLVTMMLHILRDPEPLKKLMAMVDENLMDIYPYDMVLKVATLAKACVEEDPSMRPDMKHIVFTMSQLLLTSIEWEASLAGSSQIFSGLVQGR